MTPEFMAAMDAAWYRLKDAIAALSFRRKLRWEVFNTESGKVETQWFNYSYAYVDADARNWSRYAYTVKTGEPLHPYDIYEVRRISDRQAKGDDS